MKDEVKSALSRLGRIAPFAAGAIASLQLVLIAVTFALTGQAQAAPRAGVYALVLASPLAEPRQEIVDGLLWKCAGEQCSAPAQGGRAVTACGRVARKIGPVVRFAAPQGELTSEELARCNAAR